MITSPNLIRLQKISGKSGVLSYLDEDGQLPIKVKRIYWIYDVDDGAQRGDHAHLNSDRILICMKGVVHVDLEDPKGTSVSFTLDDPSLALYFPRHHWIKLRLDKDAILVVLSSATFKEDRIISDYSEFKSFADREHVVK